MHQKSSPHYSLLDECKDVAVHLMAQDKSTTEKIFGTVSILRLYLHYRILTEVHLNVM